MSRTAAILQPGYIQWLGAYEQLARSDIFVFLDTVQHTKKDWRSRNRIKGPGGVFWLSVPVETAGRGEQKICDARISSVSPWRRKHLGTLKQFYREARYFAPVYDICRQVLDREWEYLADLNIAFLAALASYLNLKTELVRASDLACDRPDCDDRIIALCRTVSADRLYDGESAEEILDLDKFRTASIEVVFQRYVHPVYPQLHGPFISHLSILDLLFNCGPESRSILLGGSP